MKHVFYVLVLPLVVMISTTVVAQQSPQRTGLTTKSFTALPAPGPIEIRPSLDISITPRVVEVVAATLREKGYEVVERAPLVLSFETDLAWSSGRASAGQGNSSLNLEAQPDPQLRIPMPFARKQMPEQNFYSLRMSVFQQGKPPMWIGKATVVDRAQGRLAATEHMAYGLLRVLGETTPEGTVPLRPAER